MTVIWMWFPGVLQLGAQDHRFMVFFQEKNSSFNIESPTEFLSTRAIERRSRQNIAITAQDLPINGNYITSLEGQGAKVWFSTKWLNVVKWSANTSLFINFDQYQHAPFCFIDQVCGSR